MNRQGSASAPGMLREMRLDLWLWAARMYKTRALAKVAIEASRVRVSGDPVRPSRVVRIGERVDVERGDDRFELEVTGLAMRRGPASIAQSLYCESPESVARRTEAAAQRRAARAGYSAPAGKPDKRARRLIAALGDIDLM